jgi:hypothetical protein
MASKKNLTGRREEIVRKNFRSIERVLIATDSSSGVKERLLGLILTEAIRLKEGRWEQHTIRTVNQFP